MGALATFGDGSGGKVLLRQSPTRRSTTFASGTNEAVSVGRYSYTTPSANGFDYLYLVTSIIETVTPFAGFDRVCH
jgi:hypothetical protein